MNQYRLSNLKKYHLGSLGAIKGTKAKTIRTIRAIARHDKKRCIVADCESFNHHSGHKKDLFGVFDALAIELDYEPSLVLDSMETYLKSLTNGRLRYIQACATDWQPHIQKLKENIETCAICLAVPGSSIELWGWRKVKRGGKRAYRPKVQIITLNFLLEKSKPDVFELFLD